MFIRKWINLVILLFILLYLGACQIENEEKSEQKLPSEDTPVKEIEPSKDTNEHAEQENIDLERYSTTPVEWGEQVTGVKTRLATSDRVIALTFDACGGPYGNGYDSELIDFLVRENIPATLFINKRWIDEQEELFLQLVNQPLFQIENHGTRHVPLSVTGGTAWGINGTNSPEEVIEEVMGNQTRIEAMTGIAPKFFRSGTAYYDEIAVQIVQDLGLEVVNFDILGDAGATFTSEQVKNALLQAQPGSIALLHMNQPQSETAEGVKKAIPLLREKGFQFVKLNAYELE